jgi:hypothetical protein
MPLPRRSTIQRGTTKKRSAKKKTAPVGRAKKGEKLLVTCAPILTDYMTRALAETLHGSFFSDDEGRYWQVVAVRIDERARKIYGQCQEMYEAAPYMFAPV